MSICPRCAATFSCAIADQTGQPCWCTKLPVEPVLPIYPKVPNDQSLCFCPVCMQQWQQHKSPLEPQGSPIESAQRASRQE